MGVTMLDAPPPRLAPSAKCGATRWPCSPFAATTSSPATSRMPRVWLEPDRLAFSTIGVELTDRIYVVLNMRIMTHVGQAILNRLVADAAFTKCLDGKADLDIKSPADPALS